MRIADFKVISLGCYGTLIDKESGVYMALQPMLRKGEVTLGRNDVLAAFAVHEATEAAANPGLLYADLLTNVHRRLAKEWYVTVSDDDHDLFGKSVPHWPVFVDTPAALQYLQRYFKLVILSNADRRGFAGSNRRLGVKFDAVVTAQDVGSYKPSLVNFEYMLDLLAKLGLDEQSLLHAGHSLFHDHEPAAALGLASAWIDRRYGKEGGGATLPATEAARYDFRFSSMADMVKAHQCELRA